MKYNRFLFICTNKIPLMLLEAIKKSYENYFSEIYNISTQDKVKLTYRLIIYKYVIDLIFGVLTPLSAIFQLYHGDQF
jgi:ABC-type sulfate transport system permease subunit